MTSRKYDSPTRKAQPRARRAGRCGVQTVMCQGFRYRRAPFDTVGIRFRGRVVSWLWYWDWDRLTVEMCSLAPQERSPHG